MNELQEFIGVFSDTQVEILKTLGKYESLERDLIADISKIPRTTIFENINKLIKWDFVEKQKEARNKRGRPKEYYKLKDLAKEVFK